MKQSLVFLLIIGCGSKQPDLEAQIMERFDPLEPASFRSVLPQGSVEVFADPAPDFPESTFSAGAYVGVSGPASFEIPLGEDAEVRFYKRSNGAPVKTVPIPYPAFLPPGVAPNSVSVAVPGALGDVFVVQNLTGIYRINSLLGFAEQYSADAAPDVPGPCPNPPIPGAPPCDAELGLPPLANGLLLTEGGDAYVTDSFQGAIWKVDVEDRTHEQWLVAPELAGNIFSPLPLGANGLAKGTDYKLYVANTTAGPAFGGAIYRTDFESPQLELVYAWDPFQPPGSTTPLPHGPDGLRFDTQGNLWVTLAFAGQIAKLTIVDDVVVDEERFGSELFNQPSELHLDALTRRAFVANHALVPPSPENWKVLEVGTGVLGAPLEKPWIGWDCHALDCDLDGVDAVHAAVLVFEHIAAL